MLKSAMQERQASILEAVVRGFIVTGDPISSAWLYQECDFGIKPAMIRAELNSLTEEGFLEQPHHSAGRIPTDHGYEFFVSQVLHEAHGSPDRRLRYLLQTQKWPELVRTLADSLGILGVLSPVGDEIYKDGLEHLIEHLEWHSREELGDVIHDFEELDRRIEGARDALEDEEVRVFIGRKSPITRSEYLAVIAGSYRLNGEEVLLLGIGPKRMDYERSARVFKGLHHAQIK